MRRPRSRIAALFAAALFAVATGAAAQTGGGYDLSWNTVNGGGVTFATGGPYSLGATAGQPDAGNHAGGPYFHSGGFWFAAASMFTVSKDFSDDSSASVTVSVTCTTGVVTPSSAPVAEGSPAFFTVNGYTGSPTCTATEVVPAGYTADESGCLNVALTSGGCTIVNAANPGTIIVTQTTNPSPDPTNTSFNFFAGGGLTPSSFSLADGGSQTFNGVPAGSGYSIYQQVPPGWTLTTSTCSNGSPFSNVTVGPGETVTCGFVTAYTPLPVVPALDARGLLLLMLALAGVSLVVLRRQ